MMGVQWNKQSDAIVPGRLAGSFRNQKKKPSQFDIAVCAPKNSIAVGYLLHTLTRRIVATA